MSGITGYSQSGYYLYQYNNVFASGASGASNSSKACCSSSMVMISYASGASDVSGASGTSGASGMSGASGTSGASGMSGASGASDASSANTISKYSYSVLVNNYKFSPEIIEKYFTKTKDGKYTLKPDSKYKTASELRNALIQDCQTKLIIDNFLNNRNRETDSSAEMKQIFNGETELYESVTKDNYISIIDSLSYTPEKLQEFKKAALEKFVKDFSVGNLAYSLVPTVLNAIGVEHIQRKTENGNYVIKFDFDGKHYILMCNKEAAESGVDDVQAFTNRTEFFNTDIGKFATEFNRAKDKSEYSSEVLNQKAHELNEMLKTYGDDLSIADKTEIKMYMQKIVKQFFVNNGWSPSYSSMNLDDKIRCLFQKIQNGSVDINIINSLYEMRDILNVPNGVVEILETFKEKYNESIDSYNNFINECHTDIEEYEYGGNYRFDVVENALKTYAVSDRLFEYLQDTYNLEDGFADMAKGYWKDFQNGYISQDEFFVNIQNISYTKIEVETTYNPNNYVGVVLRQYLNSGEGIFYQTWDQWTGSGDFSDITSNIETYIMSKYPELNDEIYSYIGDYTGMLEFFADMSNRYVNYSGTNDTNKRIDKYFDSIDAQIQLALDAIIIYEDTEPELSLDDFVKDYINRNLVVTMERSSGRRNARSQEINDIYTQLGIPDNIDVTDLSSDTAQALKEYFINNDNYDVNVYYNGDYNVYLKGTNDPILRATDNSLQFVLKDEKVDTYIDIFRNNDPRVIYSINDSEINNALYSNYNDILNNESVTEGIAEGDIAFYQALIRNSMLFDNKNDEMNGLFRFWTNELELANMAGRESKYPDIDTTKLFNNIIDAAEKLGIYVDDLAVFSDVYSDSGKNLDTLLSKISVRYASGQEDAYEFTKTLDNSLGVFNQNKEGDCWFLASLNALKNVPGGQELLDSMFNFNPDKGTITIGFGGYSDTYTIEELLKMKEYSGGDLNIRPFEVLAQKILLTNPEYKNSPEVGLKGGLLSYFTKIFTGEDITRSLTGESLSYTAYIKKIFNNLSDNLATCSFKGEGTEKPFKVTDSLGNEIELHTRHAYTITSFDGKNVTLINPWHGDETITIPFETFIQNVKKIEYCSVEEFIEKTLEKSKKERALISYEKLHDGWAHGSSSENSNYGIGTAINNRGEYLLYKPDEELEAEGYHVEYIQGYKFIYDNEGNVVDAEVGTKWLNGLGWLVNKDGEMIDIIVEANKPKGGGGHSDEYYINMPESELNSLGYFKYNIGGKPVIFDSNGLIVAGQPTYNPELGAYVDALGNPIAESILRQARMDAMKNGKIYSLIKEGMDSDTANTLVDLLFPSAEEISSKSEGELKTIIENADKDLAAAMAVGVTFGTYEEGSITMFMPEVYYEDDLFSYLSDDYDENEFLKIQMQIDEEKERARNAMRANIKLIADMFRKSQTSE